MELILLAALNLEQPMVAEMSNFLNCAEAQAILGRLYANESLSRRQIREIAETVIGHMPINCPVPLQT